MQLNTNSVSERLLWKQHVNGVLTDLKEWGVKGCSLLGMGNQTDKKGACCSGLFCGKVWPGPTLGNMLPFEAALLTLMPKLAASQFFLPATLFPHLKAFHLYVYLLSFCVSLFA